MTNKEQVKEYYRKICEIDIAEVARELVPERITSEEKGLVHLDCPHHASQSKLSLHINPAKQSWYCFGCGVGGDVLHLVEFIQSGHVTKNTNGKMPQSHREARDWLGRKVGLPSLASQTFVTKEMEEIESSYWKNHQALLCLTELASYYHEQLKLHPEVLQWFCEKYKLSEELIIEYRLGYADNSENIKNNLKFVVPHLRDAGFDDDIIMATGAFVSDYQDNPRPTFNNRLIIPYWHHGTVTYLIGRQTPWTNPKEKAKYKKLSTHTPSSLHVAHVIDNSRLYNEDILLTDTDSVIFTEGVTDCLSGMEHGLPCVSPVTTTIRQQDWPRIIPKLTKKKTVYIIGDNEISKVGLETSIKTARHLQESGIDGRIVILPLPPAQSAARKKVTTKFGLTDYQSRHEINKIKMELPEKDRAEFLKLAEEAKCDLNSWFASGGTKKELFKLLETAQTPLEYAVSQLDPEADKRTLDSEITMILRNAAILPLIAQNEILDLLKEKLGKAVTKNALLSQIRKYSTEAKKEQRTKARKAELQVTAPIGTCKNVVQSTVVEGLKNGEPRDYIYASAAEAAFHWFIEHGGRFFQTSAGEPFMLWDHRLYFMKSRESGKRALYNSMLYQYTGLPETAVSGRTFREVLANLTNERGEIRDGFSWLHTDIENSTVYFNLNNDRHEIAKISPKGVEIIPNGANEDRIYLEISPKMEPIEYDPAIEEPEKQLLAESLIKQLIIDNLACEETDRPFILLWACTFLLMEFSGSRPLTRFEGNAACGKTTAAKLLSTLFFGKPSQKQGTLAADRVDSEKSPFLWLDNIESRQLDEERLNFFLVAATGIGIEKRNMDSSSAISIENPKCLINTSGIEPMGDDKTEVQSRTFTFQFDNRFKSGHIFYEPLVIDQIKKHRNLMLSYVLLSTSAVLRLIANGREYRAARELIEKELGPHERQRCNDYLTLMYLMYINSQPEELESYLQELDWNFKDAILRNNRRSRRVAADSNPIAVCLSSLFSMYVRAEQSSFSDAELRELQKRYQCKIKNYVLGPHTAKDLFITLKKVAYDSRIKFPYQSVMQFIKRLTNDLEIIEEAGFQVQMQERYSRKRFWTIELMDDTTDTDDSDDTGDDADVHSDGEIAEDF